MTDRGTHAVVQDAPAYDADTFLHVEESYGSYGSTVTEHSPSIANSAFVTDGTFEHRVDDAVDLPVDWGNIGAKHTGDGWYMTAPVTGVVTLQGAPAGRAAVTGGLSLDAGFAGSSAGVASVTGALRRAISLTGHSDGHAATSSTLRNVKPLAATVAGHAAVTASLTTLGNLNPLAGSVSGATAVTGSLTMTMGLSGEAAGGAHLGVAGEQYITFEDDTLPDGAISYYDQFVPSPGPSPIVHVVPATFVARTDEGTTRALRQYDIANREKARTVIPFTWSGTTAQSLRVRYFMQSEAGYDLAKLYLDGTLFHSDSGTSSAVEEVARTGIAPGPHELTIEYAKDISGSSGFDNIDVTKIAFMGVIGPTLDIASAGIVVLAGSATGLASMAGSLDTYRETKLRATRTRFV